MKEIPVESAVGHVLCQDLTQIIPGVSKGPRFRKGHIVQQEDISVLLRMGKEHLYVWEKRDGMLHENEAAERLCKICKGENISRGAVSEGKIELFSEIDGLFQVDTERLNQVNAIGQLMIATRHGNTVVHKGDKLAGTRVIPLVIAEEPLCKAEDLVQEHPILQVLPFKKKKTAIVTIGSEVASGRIQDAFGPVIRQKLAEFDVPCMGQSIVKDDAEATTAEIQKWIAQGAEMVLCTGGMSVDPDDRTPLAIRNTGAQVVTYGAPVLPGAMLMLAYTMQGVPIVGLPGCVMYAKRTIFDLILPRLLANQKVTAQEIATLGEGGLCLGCAECTYPNCGFGKGW